MMVQATQQDRLGSSSQAPKNCASRVKRIADVPSVMPDRGGQGRTSIPWVAALPEVW